MRGPVATAVLLSSPLLSGAEPPSAQSTVIRLYQDYAWEVVVAEPAKFGIGIFQAPVATLRQYFVPELAARLAEDRACVERTGEICRLSFSPIWAGQDPSVVGLSVEPGSEPAQVRVRFTNPSAVQEVELTYTLEQTSAGWRISNITAADWDLRDILGDAP